jgi:vacuolar-type H+-ATPase subunit E/Vma4
MQNEFLGVVAPEEEGGEGEEEGEGAVGGKLGEAERALDEALNKFAQDTAASKAGLEKAGRGLGAGLKKQQTELTSMIGKTNLAQAGQRQQEELNETVMDQLSEATTEKEVAMGEAATAKTEAVAEHEGAMTDIQVKYDQGIKDLLDNLEDSTGKSAFTERYDTTKGTISDNSEGYYRSGTDVWSKSGSGQDNDTFINTFESINLESFLSDPQNPQMDTKTIITKKIKNDPGPRFNPWGPVEKDEYSYFDNIRTKKNSCFIGSTQILMGDSNE